MTRIARLAFCASLVALTAPIDPAEAQVIVACASQCTASTQIIGCDNRTQGPTDADDALSSSGP